MHIKTTNRLFLVSIIVSFVSMFIMDGVPDVWGIHELIPYLIFFVISIIVIKRDGAEFFEVLPYNKKISCKEIVLIILLTFLLYPANNLFSQIGSMLGGDVVSLGMGAIEDAIGDNLVEQLFVVAVIPAVFEEMYFRGFFFSGYRKYRGARTAIILSSVLFGLFHMNFQQFLYATILGIIIAVIRELTGSMWAGMLFHFANNAMAVIMGYIENNNEGLDKIVKKYGPISNMNFDDMAHTIYTIVAFVVSLPLVYLVLKAIAKGRNRESDFKTFFKENTAKEKERLVSASLVISIVFYVLVVLIIFAAVKSGFAAEFFSFAK